MGNPQFNPDEIPEDISKSALLYGEGAGIFRNAFNTAARKSVGAAKLCQDYVHKGAGQWIERAVRKVTGYEIPSSDLATSFQGSVTSQTGPRTTSRHAELAAPRTGPERTANGAIPLPQHTQS